VPNPNVENPLKRFWFVTLSLTQLQWRQAQLDF